jgi:hypothetical protein
MIQTQFEGDQNRIVEVFCEFSIVIFFLLLYRMLSKEINKKCESFRQNVDNLSKENTELKQIIKVKMAVSLTKDYF